MAMYKISGVWKDVTGAITHYAMHLPSNGGCLMAEKKTKSEAVALLQIPGNSAKALLWNYAASSWKDGEDVTVVTPDKGEKHLRSIPDGKVSDNLAHLINYDYVRC